MPHFLLPCCIIKFGGLKLYDTLAQTDIVLLRQAAVRTLVEMSSLINWWLCASKALFIGMKGGT